MINIDIKKTLHTSDGIIDLKIKLDIEQNKFIAISGKSGSGKTTLLRIFSGLTNPDEGKIVVSGKVWYDSQKKINIPPQKRKIGFVFQDYALFPNMTIRKNLLYAFNDPVIIDELLEIMELTLLQNRYPDKLSGGQRQRVALARAIAGKPDILLLDEPLSSLEPKMREKLQEEIIKIYKLFNITIILVSHDIPEIFKLSSRIIFIEKGKIIKDGKPIDIFLNNVTSHKFSFIGELIQIKKIDIIYIALVSVGNNVCEIVLCEDDIKDLKTGDKIFVASKAFNPIIKKIDE